MAILNTKYYSGDDRYSDGDIEDELLDIVKTGRTLNELDKDKVSYPILYHLSTVRENILNWFPFEETDKILEVGAGCGAITGALCKKTKKVVSVDLSKRRASINYERHKDINNLEIWVGNLNDMDFGEKFDYVILNGVFEYAISFTEGDKPYHTFLQNMLKFLKPEGKILIAIENRLGLKYFAGAPEDHTDAFVEGINGYEFNENVRTFSKKELIQILDNCGLKDYKFYYPYPDYKFPIEIFTDETLNEMGYGRDYYNFLNKRMLLFNETLVAKTLASEGVVSVFANSFLVEASFQDIVRDTEVLYAKINADRNPEFQTVTLIEQKSDKKYVVKKALTDVAQKHIENLYINEKVTISNVYHNLPSEKRGDALIYSYLELDTLDMDIEKYIEKKDSKKIVQILGNIFDSSFKESRNIEDIYSEEFQRVFGKEKLLQKLECVKPANIDLICDNIFREKDQYAVIDCEWIFNFWIPKAFIIWRCLNELYVKHGRELQKLIPNQELEIMFGISEEMKLVFAAWNHYFTEVYVGANKLRNYAKPKLQVSLDQVFNYENIKRTICSSLYYDCGNGYSEENKIYEETLLLDNAFEIKYDLSNLDGINNLRWDPVERRACKCSVKAFADGKEVILKPANADGREGESDIFIISDPNYFIENTLSKISEIKIVGNIQYMDEGEILQEHEKLRGEYWSKKKEIEIVRNDLCEEIATKNRIKNQLQETQNTLEKIENKRNAFKNYIEVLEVEFDDLEKRNTELKKNNLYLERETDKKDRQLEQLKLQVKELVVQKAEVERNLSSVLNSKGWKLLDKIRKYIPR